MEEKFGIVIEAVTDGFKAKMNEIKNLGQQTAERIKTAWTKTNVEPKIDLSNLTKVQTATRGLANQLKQTHSFDILDTGTIDVFSNKITLLSGKAKFMRDNFRLIRPEIQGVARDMNNINAKKIEKISDNSKGASSGIGLLSSKIGKLTKVGLIFGAIGSAIGHFVDKARQKFKVFGLAILQIRSLIQGLRTAVHQYLSFDVKLQDQLTDTWAGLGAQLAPIIQGIINMFSKAVSYINAFISALFGVNMIARANKKALDSQSKSAKNTAKSLSSIDEITNIQKEKDNGGGADVPKIELPKVDTSGIEKFAKKLKELFKEGKYFEAGKYIGETLTEQLEKIDWKKIHTKARNLATAIVDTINGFIAGTNWKTVGNTIAQGINTAIIFVSTLVKRFNWKKFGKSMGELFESTITNIDWKELAEGISAFAIGVFDFIGSALEAVDWAKVGKKIREFIKAIDWKGIGTAFVKAFISFNKAIWDFSTAIKGFKSIGENLITALFLGMFGPIGSLIYNLFGSKFIQAVKDILGVHSPSTVFMEIGKNVVDGFFTYIKTIPEKIKSYFIKAKDNAINAFSNAKNKFGEIFNSIVDKFRNIGTKVGNAVGSAFKIVINTVLNRVGSMINSFIRAINNAIKVINKIPGVDITKLTEINIPKLATGTNYVPEDQLAYIHKGEAVVPKKFNSAEYFNNMNNTQETNALLLEANRTLLEILEKPSTFEVNGKELARTTYNDFKNEGNRLGQSSVVNVR